MPTRRTLIHDQLDLKPGNFVVERIEILHWGSRVVVDCVYRHPPDEKEFRLVFDDCRSLDWYMQKTGAAMTMAEDTLLLSHDLGESGYRRTARLATTLVELIISYDKLKIERDWT